MAVSVTRCDPPLPVTTPKGPGLAHWRIERGIEMPTAYEVWISSGEFALQIWEFDQRDIRAEHNVTARRIGPACAG